MEGKKEGLEAAIGYVFRDPELLGHALRHSSYTNEKHMPKTACNERLEFLGDAVLELISSGFLFTSYPDLAEGELTKLRAALVCETSLADCARGIHLGGYLLLGKGEERSGGRERDSVISDAFEALIGALYLDGGLSCAEAFVKDTVLKDVEARKLFYDSKTVLQEMVQAEARGAISYRLLKEEGPDHQKIFYVAVFIGDKEYGKGRGSSKKTAEQHAAYQAICRLQNRSGVCT